MRFAQIAVNRCSIRRPSRRIRALESAVFSHAGAAAIADTELENSGIAAAFDSPPADAVLRGVNWIR